MKIHADGFSFWGSKYMSSAYLVPDVLGEVKFLTSGSSSCPWDAVELATHCLLGLHLLVLWLHLRIESLFSPLPPLFDCSSGELGFAVEAK